MGFSIVVGLGGPGREVGTIAAVSLLRGGSWRARPGAEVGFGYLIGVCTHDWITFLVLGRGWVTRVIGLCGRAWIVAIRRLCVAIGSVDVALPRLFAEASVNRIACR